MYSYRRKIVTSVGHSFFADSFGVTVLAVSICGLSFCVVKIVHVLIGPKVCSCKNGNVLQCFKLISAPPKLYQGNYE